LGLGATQGGQPASGLARDQRFQAGVHDGGLLGDSRELFRLLDQLVIQDEGSFSYA
jgi:hypothetical protein